MNVKSCQTFCFRLTGRQKALLTAISSMETIQCPNYLLSNGDGAPLFNRWIKSLTHGTTQSRENEILPHNTSHCTHFLITSYYTNKHWSTHYNHHKYHSHYVSSRTLLKLLDLLRQDVLSYVPVMPAWQNAAIEDGSFLPFCYVTKQEFLLHLHHSDIQYLTSEELWIFTWMLMSILACLTLCRHTWTPLFGKQERKIIKKKKHKPAFIYVYFTERYCRLKTYTSIWHGFCKILIPIHYYLQKCHSDINSRA